MNQIDILNSTQHLTLEECEGVNLKEIVSRPDFHQIIKRQTAGENPVPIVCIQFVKVVPPDTEL